MNLDRIYVFPIDSPLTPAKRRAIDAHMNAQVFDRELTYKWLKRGDERFMRIIVDPVTIEVVFFEDRIEFFGAAPAVARLLFTKARKKELKERLEQMIVSAGFVVGDQVT